MIVIKDGHGPGIIAMDQEGLMMGALSSNFICRSADFYHTLVMCGLREYLLKSGYLSRKCYESTCGTINGVPQTRTSVDFIVERDFRITFGDQATHDYKVGKYASPQFQDVLKMGGQLYQPGRQVRY